MAMKKANPKPAGKPQKEKTESGKKLNTEAHDLAEKDIEKDPDLNMKTHREDDMDEGELARLEGED